MFGIGANELIIILLFGFLIFGPDKLPAMAKTIGKAIAKFRTAQAEMNNVIRNEVYDPNSDDPFKNPLDTLAKVEERVTREDRGESFSERKARYDKQRAASKAAKERTARGEGAKSTTDEVGAAAAAATAAAAAAGDGAKDSAEEKKADAPKAKEAPADATESKSAASDAKASSADAKGAADAKDAADGGTADNSAADSNAADDAKPKISADELYGVTKKARKPKKSADAPSASGEESASGKSRAGAAKKSASSLAGEVDKVAEEAVDAPAAKEGE